LIIAHKKAL